MSSDQQGVRVSVVISNYNPKGNLLPCIERALILPATPGTLQVVFARHGVISSGDEAALTTLAESNACFRLLAGWYDNRAEALNAAGNAADGDLLLFLESHVLAPPALVSAFEAVLEDPTVHAVQGAFKTRVNSNWVGVLEDELRVEARRRRRAAGLPADEFNLHAAVIRRDAFLTDGGFDVRLPSLAEVLLLHRLDVAGRLRWLDHPEVEHINHAIWGHYLDSLEDRGREVALLRALHPREGRLLYRLPQLDRHEAAIRRWRWPLSWAVGGARRVARVGCAALHALGVSALERRCALWLASLTIRRGFLGAFR